MGNVADPPQLSQQDLPVEAASGLLESGITVREVLGLPAMRGARLLAGAGGLDRHVRRLNVMEVPDVLPWVKPHELLLTTGYPVRATPDGVPDLLAALDDRGLAAVAIKLHRYLDEVPAEALAVADRRELPLIQLPDHVGFDDILNQVLTEVLNRQAAVLERSEEVHRALVEVVLEGGGLEELATKMAEVLGGPVLVTTPDGRILARGGEPDELDRLMRTSCFDPDGRFLAEREPHGVHRHDDMAGWHAVVPVVAGRIDHGRIVGFSQERPLEEEDVHVLERAATVAALAVTKQLAVRAVEGKYRGDFLRDVLGGAAGDRARVVAHCESLGWDVGRPLVVVVAELDPQVAAPDRSGLELRPLQERLAAAWDSAVRARDLRAPVVGFTQEVVALLGVPEGSDPDRVVGDIVREVARDRGVRRRSFATGVSRVVEKPDRIPEAYEQARRAVQVGRQLHGPGAVASFDSLGTFRLLSMVRDPLELREFAAETLGPLAADDADAAELRRTLQVLFDTNLNVAASARRLFIHYNTLRHRIGKLERLVGPFGSDPDLRLNLTLALKVLQMRGLGG